MISRLTAVLIPIVKADMPHSRCSTGLTCQVISNPLNHYQNAKHMNFFRMDVSLVCAD